MSRRSTRWDFRRSPAGKRIATSGVSPWFALFRFFVCNPGGWIAIAVIAIVTDYMTGRYIQFPIVFSLPVLFAAWHRGQRWGLPLAVVLPVLRGSVVLFQDGQTRLDVLAINTLILIAVLTLLAVLASQVSKQRDLQSIIDGHRKSLDAARVIQERLFPAASPDMPGFDIAGACHPAHSTAGDYFDFIPLADKTLMITVGDVSGHGMGPALLMADIHAYFRALSKSHTEPGEILTVANQLVCNDITEGRFITVLIVRIDHVTHSLVYASAGQYAFLLDAAANPTKLVSMSVPLGLLANETFPQSEPITLEPGQCLLLLSDGVFEAKSPTEELFGSARVLESVRNHYHQTADQILRALLADVAEFEAGSPRQDDCTAVIVKVVAA